MDGQTIQAKQFRGYAIAAAKVGFPFSQYRPGIAANAIAPENLLQVLSASFNAEDMQYGKPNKYGKPTWYCIADGTQLAVGDYLQGAQGTFFIAAMQPLLPILAVECNRTVSIFRPQQIAGVGAVGYGGNTTAAQMPLAQNWPVSLLQASKVETGAVKLPGDARQGAWTMLLSALPTGATLKNDDVVTDDLGNRYLIYSAELTDLGWRCQVMESET